MTLGERRAAVFDWLGAAVAAVDPEQKTAEALATTRQEAPTVIAIGKAAAAMCRGAHRALGPLTGLCVTGSPAPVPAGIDLVLGDHPVPGERSFDAGRRALETVRSAPGPVIALISGGGSALCESPLPGIDPSYIGLVNSRLLDGGASIGETNLVRCHLSSVKAGGIARGATGRLATYILSDVSGAGPELVASGPTIPMKRDPERAREVMERFGIPVDEVVWAVMTAGFEETPVEGPVEVLGDGRMAAAAVVEAARAQGVGATLADGWIAGELESAIREFVAHSSPGVTVAAGEPNVKVQGNGVGGRNSHVALKMAEAIADSDAVFAAFATDGVDGNSDGAGGIVDGTTIARGGDPAEARARCDSATYLDRIGDLIRTGPTGTNVSDLWLLWRNESPGKLN